MSSTFSRSISDSAPGPALLPATTARVRCRACDGPGDLSEHFAVRREVFVEQQELFTDHDFDEHDGAGGTVHVVAAVDAEVVGTVRIYPIGEGRRWCGDRLAVRRGSRSRHGGAALVRFAVATASALGGEIMVARVQLQNRDFFTALGWHYDGPVAPYHGALHQPMRTVLSVGPRDPGGGR